MSYKPDLNEAKAQLFKMRNPGKGAFGDRQLGGAAPYPVFATSEFSKDAAHALRDGHEFQDWPRVMYWQETNRAAARAPAWSSLRAGALVAYARHADALALGTDGGGGGGTGGGAPTDAGRARALTHARHRFNPDLRRAHSMALGGGGENGGGHGAAARNVVVAEEWPPRAAAAHAAVLGAAAAAAERRAAAASKAFSAGTLPRPRATSGLSLEGAAPGSARPQSPQSPLAPSTTDPLRGSTGKVPGTPGSSGSPAAAKAKHRKRRPAVEPAPFADRF